MIGGAVAASCGSWSFPYLNACMNFVFSLYHLAFTMPAIQVPLAPSTPLALHSVSFRADKNIFLNKTELAKVVECGRKRKNPNPNKKYDTLLLMNNSQEESVGRSYIRESKSSASDFSLRTFYHELRKTSESNFTALLR